MSWAAIWAARNGAIFRHMQPSIAHCKAVFKREFAQVIFLAKKKKSLAPRLSQWLQVYV